MKIEVTQEDIDKGVHNNCSCCPTARALYRQTNLYWSVYTGDAGSYYTDLWIDFPPEATAFIIAFDEKLPVKPFSFEFDYNS